MTNTKTDNDLPIDEIYEFLCDSSKYEVLDNDGNLIEVHDILYENFVSNLIKIDKFVTAVLSSEEPAFRMREFFVFRRDITIPKTHLDRLPLSKYFTTVISLAENLLPDYMYSHSVELFFRSCLDLNLSNEWFKNPLAPTSRNGILAYELFNDLIGLIRIGAKSAEFRDKARDWQYNSNRNYKSAVEFVEGLFVRRLMVLRVDLYYQSEFARSISPEEAKSDLARFLYNLRRNKGLSDNLEGYIWKWEYGHQKKIHCHMLFFYDGSKVQNDGYWAHKLGSYWCDTITKGRGRFYNGNTKINKAKYENKNLLGIGMIGRIHEDVTKDTGKVMRDILINCIIKYMLKADQVLLAISLGGAEFRIFGKGTGTNHH